ncbi:efflux RND transporter permease subunit [Desulfofustis glycolicus]|uniref:Hydrophobic/amphiphilic exporter-1, HAE1 family n=1 Tax=Desulfofustis glycolicus DSM 9705 TaxID=1121409 RepID=A0A1M5SMF4_9BACT|nr:efflux RND transporter permease subunit [Desulfofustis glycolicus]MCB2215639.1 efflux RND transporter permease subunit [Desulfobulbaceae bacterium]SHH39712.1 hydrophobic/amphiphilic exporter-1, HAE1 family [Desulfofustis glycolicus DSM 9705]
MNISAFTTLRPIFTIMVTLIIILIGVVSLSRLPIDLLPEISYPALSINTSYGNAAPEEVENLVTEVIERAVMAIQGIEEVTSESTEGNSRVRVSFTWGTNLDAATNDVRDRLDRIIDDLPEEIDRPQLRKFDPNSAPILIYGAASDLDPIELRRLIDDQISYRLEQVPGVATLDVWGGLEREIRIEIDLDRLRALQLSLDTVRNAIRDANISLPAGTIESGNTEIRLRTPGELTSVGQLLDLVVDRRNDTPIYLKQVATVSDTHAEITRIVRVNGKPGVYLAVRKQSGTNTVEVAQQAKKVIDQINRDFPQIQIIPVIDTSDYIQRSLANVGRTIVIGGLLAVFVLLTFLRNIRATLVVTTAIPVAIISTFAMMYFGNLTLNLMTLGGLALGVGMMVDNSIVVLENILRRHQELHESPKEAAINGAREVAGAIVASTCTTLAIFVPMLFAQEISGLLFRQLTYVVAFSLLCSLFVALTLVPMLTRLFLGIRREKHGLVKRAADRVGRLHDRLNRRYATLLDAALQAPRTTVFVVFLVFGLSLTLLPLIGTEFMPASDEGEVRVDVSMAGGTRLDVLDETMRGVEQVVIDAVPEMRAAVVTMGSSSGRGDAAGGNVRLSLVPLLERERSSSQVAADLRRQIGVVPGAEVRVRAGQGMFLLSRLMGGGEDNLEVEIRGYDLSTLDRLAETVEDRIKDIPGITDTRRGREEGVPQTLLEIDRDRAADLGLSVAQIARTLETALSGTRAGQFRDGSGEDVDILVQVKNAKLLSIEELLTLTVSNNDGQAVSLRNLLTPRSSLGPVEIERKNQQRLVAVLANVANRPLGEVAADVQQQLSDVPRPRGYEILMAGDVEQQAESFREMLIGIILATLLVYMVMASLYESLLPPAIVMFSVPLPLIGVILVLLLTGTTFNVQSFIGCIMLVGIVVNNAILIVDRANTLFRDEGLDLLAAVRAAGRDRLRPVLMTSLTTVLSLLPLALGIGEGSDMQAPLARTVLGGLLSASLITLIFIPVVFLLFNRRKEQRRAILAGGGS